MPAKKPLRRAPLKRKTPLSPTPLARGGARARGLASAGEVARAAPSKKKGAGSAVASAPEKRRRSRVTAPPAAGGRTRRSSKAAPLRSASAEDPRAPRPFVKWAGGKRQLLPQILAKLPPSFGTYHEPFVGGGAVFFAVAAGKKAVLSDSNERLVRAYKGIKSDVEQVIALLDEYPKSREFFLSMRDQDIDRRSDAEVAAWFIYMNKLAFNGLYRVNSKNKFNVPYGDNENAVICDRDNLRACARALVNATIEREEFLDVGRRAEPGDLVYFDPPYFPLSATSYFTSYTARGFTRRDQEKLRDLAMELKERGVHVLLSNSPPAAELYTKELGFRVTEVLAARNVNSKAELRGKITELLIH